jgi:hypothetical protein
MKRILDSVVPAVVCAALVALTLTPPAPGCAPVTRAGGRVTIASESAIIIWDEKTKTEHFIRRASFETRVPYFGFLVPSPTTPELAEAPDQLFKDLEEWSKPETVTQKVPRPNVTPGGRSLGKADNAFPTSVQVLNEQFVAGFKAVSLKADDPVKMQQWLDEHEYVTRPDLDKWLEPYVKAGWVITAFQITKDNQASTGLSTQAVRMSFKTDRPFYPYAEPADQREKGSFRPGRLLRLFVLGTARMEGKLDHKTTTWPGRPAWANTLSAEQRDKLLSGLGDAVKGSLVEKPWLTVFDDPSSPRPGVADLFFSVSADQSTLARPPIINYVYVDGPLVWSWQMVAVAGLSVVLVAVFGVLMWKGLTALNAEGTKPKPE